MFHLLIFIVSFIVAKQGFLNENIYVKQFAFDFFFLVMLVISMIQSLKHNMNTVFRVTLGDVFISYVNIVMLRRCSELINS